MESDRLLYKGIQPVARAVIYDPETGAIVGSHSFSASGGLTERARQKWESVLQRQMADLEKRHNRNLAIYRSPELMELSTLSHRLDVASGRLVQQPPSAQANERTLPGRLVVE
jgi:hypothetical protein